MNRPIAQATVRPRDRVFAPVAKHLAALQQSAARYPHIKPGEEFSGY